MKKRTKRMIQAGAGLVIVAVAGFWATTTSLDYTPSIRAGYYEATRARLEASRASDPLVAGPLEAGFGRALLIPEGYGTADQKGLIAGLPLAGYGARRGRPATGAHDSLWAKAVAFKVSTQTVVMVSADTLIIPRPVADEVVSIVGRELRLGRDRIYFGATHTHAGPGGWGEGFVAESFAGPFRPEVPAWFAGQLASAIRAACADLSPASLGHDRFEAPGYVRNRLVGDSGQLNTTFNYLVVRQADGDMAMLGAYAAHATVLPADVMEFSGDYPGRWQAAVERATGGTALFFGGAVGSHGPVAGARGFEGAQRMGEALAKMVVDRLSTTPLTNDVTLGMVSLQVTLPELHVRLSDERRLRPFVARRLLPLSDTTWIQALRLGGTVWISTPCDFSGELALGLEDWLYGRGRQAVVTSFNGDYIGYIIPGKYYHLPGYESRTMSFFGPGMADYLEDMLRTLALRVTQ